MKKYDVKEVLMSEMIERNDYDFAIKEDDEFKLYIPDDSGKKKVFLDERMGDYANEILEEFLIGLDSIYKDIFSDKEVIYVKIITLMFIYLHLNYGSLKNGGFSFCSHSQGFISFYADRSRVENFLEEQYKKNRALLEHCYICYSKEKDNNGQMYNILQNCISIVSEVAGDKITDGSIRFVNERTEKTTLDASVFHKNLYSNTSFVKKINCDHDFSIKRFTTICFYTFLKNVGINYKKRCIITYMIYRYIEDKFDFRYMDILAGEHDYKN